MIGNSLIYLVEIANLRLFETHSIIGGYSKECRIQDRYY